MKLKIGQTAPIFQTECVLGNNIDLADMKGKKIFLAFLRNTHCPLCSYHVFKLSQKADYFKSLGLQILVFYESKKKMFENSDFFKKNVFKDNKFSIISDPARKLYELYGAEVSPFKAQMELLEKNGRFSVMSEILQLGITGNGMEEGTNPDAIPADFLIDENLIIRHAHYGIDAGDNIDLHLVENFASEHKHSNSSFLA